MQTGDKGYKIIMDAEGYEKPLADGSCKAYLDTLAAKKYWSKGYKGLWTIGYGCTEGVTENLVWTKSQALGKLKEEVAKHETAITKMLKVTANQNQFDALVSFSYNLGPSTLKKSSIMRLFNKGDTTGAAEVFQIYNKAGGKVYQGLVSRRKAERDLFLMAVPAEVVDASRKLTWMRRFRMFISSLGLGTVLSWDNLLQVRSFMNDHAGLIALGAGATLFVLARSFEDRSVQDYESGRWVPSGMGVKK